MNCNVIISVLQWSQVTPVSGLFNPQRGPYPRVENHCVTVNGHRNMEASLPLVAGSCSFAGRIIHMERGQLKWSDFTSFLSILKAYMVCTVCQELLKVLFKYKPLSRLATR